MSVCLSALQFSETYEQIGALLYIVYAVSEPDDQDNYIFLGFRVSTACNCPASASDSVRGDAYGVCDPLPLACSSLCVSVSKTVEI